MDRAGLYDTSLNGISPVTIASIDIGTNTVLLLVASVGAEGEIAPLVYEQRIPRLGQGVDAHRHLHPDSMARVAEVLKEYREILRPLRSDAVVVCGTSAVRDAANRQEFCDLVKREAGYDLEVLSGQEESLWTYRGAISGFPGLSRATVVDIGGGSTEISVGTRMAVENNISLDIGSVRITERIFRGDPPSAEEMDHSRALVREHLAQAAGFPFAGTSLIAVAGTATTLALLAQGSEAFDIGAVTSYHLTFDAVERMLQKLRAMSSSAIRELSPVMAGRADVITAGTLILREVMERFGFNEALVSERGVRYGLVIREVEKRRRIRREGH
jgi:exopolyphosphatase / guanosine-5'-triphosphate,3'-diphosphate pyrophosphatase